MIKRFAPLFPLICCILVFYSILFPSRDRRMIVSIRADLDRLASENALYRTNLLASVSYVRDLVNSGALYRGSDGMEEGGGDSAGPRFSPPALPPVPPSSYFVAQGRAGFRSGSAYWLVGDDSPWGVIDSVYRGGFVADGLRYSFVDRAVLNE